MASNGNKQVAADEAQNGAVVPSPRILRLIRLMENEATAALEDSSFKGDDVMDIFEAETKEEMYEADQREPLNMQKLAGCELEILDIEIKFSRAQASANTEAITSIFTTPEGKQLYVMFKAARIRKTGEEKRSVKLPEVGEVFQGNTSARFCVAKLMWLYTRGEVDATEGKTERVKVKGTPLEGGQEVIKLLPIEPATVSATTE